MDAPRSSLAVGHGVHYFASAVDAVAAGKAAWVLGMHGCKVNYYTTVLQFQVGYLSQEFQFPFLAQGFDHHLHVDAELGAGNPNKGAAAASVRLRTLRAHAFQGLHAFAAIVDDSHREALPYENHAVLLGKLVFVIKR